QRLAFAILGGCLYLLDRLTNSPQSSLSTQYFERLKQRRRVLAAANCHPNGLKHLARFDAEFLRSPAKRVIERVMLEVGVREQVARAFQNSVRHGLVALLWNQFGEVIRSQLIHKKEIGHGEDVAQQLDPLPDQVRYLQHLARIDLESRLSHDAEKAIAELVFRQGADVLGIQPDRFRIKHLLGRSSRLLEIDDRIGPIDTFKREGIDQFRNAHLLAIVLGRPPQQAQKIDECVWQEASVSVGGYADHGAVPPFGQFGTVGRDQQGEMSELRRS